MLTNRNMQDFVALQNAVSALAIARFKEEHKDDRTYDEVEFAVSFTGDVVIVYDVEGDGDEALCDTYQLDEFGQ